MPAWPGTLPPSPLADGWSQQMADNRYRFDPRQGRTMMRRKQSTRLDTQNVTFKLTAAQKVLFETFYHTTIADGVLSFTFVDPPSGVTYSFQFVGDPPEFTTPDGGNNYMVRAKIMRIS